MKKIKTVLLFSICLMFSVLAFACTSKKKEEHNFVTSITLTSDKLNLDNNEITLRPTESFNFSVLINPTNAENNSIKYILTDTTPISLVINPDDNTKAQIIAKGDIIGPVTTYLQVVTEDETVRSNTLKINILTDKIKLPTPQNIKYDVENQKITWDEVEFSNGYEVSIKIEGEEDTTVKTVENSLIINEYFDKIIAIKVKCLGNELSYFDGDYSDKFYKFLQLKEPENLSHENCFIKFDKVENAKSYTILVYEENIKENPDYTFEVLDSELDEAVGYKIDILDTEGKTYFVKVKANPVDRNDVETYSSKSENYIEISKFVTPVVNSAEFKFTYNTKTLSWKSISNASGYIVTRINGNNRKVYNFNSDENYLVLDTNDDKLDAGIYSYTLKILGNGIEYLNSNESSQIQIEKLSTPNFTVSEGLLKWNSILNADGYLLKIDNQNYTTLSKEKTEFELGSNYPAKEYSFIISSIGDGKNTLSSEPCSIFKAVKLNTPNKACINSNQYLKISTQMLTENLKVYLTYNQQKSTEMNFNDLLIDTDNNVKNASIDMASENYEAGSYSVYAVNYKKGCFTSEPSEIFVFNKLLSENKVCIKNGKLSFNIPEDIYDYKLYLNGNEVSYNNDKFYQIDDNSEIEIISGQDYNLAFRYYPKLTDINTVFSNISNNFNFSKLTKADKLFVENGEIKLSSSTMGNTKYEVKVDENNIKEYSSIDQIKLEDETIYTIRMFYFGGTTNLSSDYSNIITVKLIKNVTDLTLNGDTLSFSTIDNVNGYLAKINNESKVINKDLGVTNSFSLNTIIMENFYDSEIQDYNEQPYNNLKNPLEIYISCYGETLQEPVGNEDIIIGLNRDKYSTAGQNKSNSVKVKLLPSPYNLFATNLNISMKGYDLNELYFYCDEEANLFEFKYNDSSKMVSLGKGLTFEGVLQDSQNIVVYKIDTEFLPSNVYDFSIKSVAQTKAETNGIDIVYNINGYDEATSNNVKKLSPVSGLSVNRDGATEKITITDSDTDYGYILTVNGNNIYEDVLGDGNDLDYLYGLANNALQNTDIDGLNVVLGYINAFKSKQRVLPRSFKGENLNCYKVALPKISSINILTALSALSEFQNGGCAISSNLMPQNFKLKRISTPKINIINGKLEWNAIEKAEKYFIYGTKIEEEKTVVDLENKVAELNSGVNSFDIYNYLNGAAGVYSYTMYSKTTDNNLLSSNFSYEITFKILDIPTLKAEDGEIKWDSVEDSAGYYLEIYSNEKLIDSFTVDSTVINYDVMKTSKNKVIEGGVYDFKIKALGELTGDTTGIMTSLLSSNYRATKLNTPNQVFIKDGFINLTSVNTEGVEYYGVNINDTERRIELNDLVFELDSSYRAGKYNFTYYAKGTGNYLTSNLSSITNAEKLAASNNIYVYEGELFFNGISYLNYTNSYLVNIKRENIVSSVIQSNTSINMNDIESNIYNVEVKCLGDDYYLNSDFTVLNNVVKLGSISNFKIKNGKLTWVNPERLAGLDANTSVSPNGLQLSLTFINTGKISNLILENLEEEFVLDNQYETGDYYAEIKNIGDTENSTNTFTYVNSDIVEYSKEISNITTKEFTKLKPIVDLNIKDGINLAWTNKNLLNNKYVVYINHTINENIIYCEGVLYSNNKTFIFENICYYVDDEDKNQLVLITDENITLVDSELYYVKDGEQYKVNKFETEGSFEVSMRAYGDEDFITSNVCESIIIVKPAPVTNLQVTHGKITWTASEEANGYILTLSRTDLVGNVGTDDLEYNKLNKIVYVTNKSYYNLTTAQRIYNISVRAYSLVSEGNEQTMASDSVSIKNYKFDTFDGSGTEEDPYIIKDENTLICMKYNNFATYKLLNDISLTQNFESLFTPDNPFVGKLLGNNNTISNVNISSLTNDSIYVGLLGYIDQQEITDDRLIEESGNFVRQKTTNKHIGFISDLSLTDVNISVGCYVGAIAGYNNGVISNVSAIGDINSLSKVPVDVGASIRSIYSGGITAVNDNKVEKSVSLINIKPTQETIAYSGGICAINNGEVFCCESNATLYGVIVGGITANNFNLIEGSRVYGDIWCYNFISNESELLTQAGGICALNETNGQVLNCLVYNYNYGLNNSGIMNNSADNTTSGGTSYIGGLIGDNKGLFANNIVQITLFNIDDTITCNCGKLVGFNRNNNASYNYCLSGNQGDAISLVGGGYGLDNNTNLEVNNIIDENIVSELNNNEYKNDLFDWKIIEEGGYKYLNIVMSD